MHLATLARIPIRFEGSEDQVAMSCNESISTGCEAWRTRWYHDDPYFKADPDIAGIGVRFCDFLPKFW